MIIFMSNMNLRYVLVYSLFENTDADIKYIAS